MERAIMNEKERGIEFASFISVWGLREAIQRRLVDLGVGAFCNVMVTHNGKQLTLSGTVDSRKTYAEILSMIPDEEQCIAYDIRVAARPSRFSLAS